MSGQVLFNQFASTDRLKRGGFSDEQARASAEALSDAFSETVATKYDLARVETAFERLEGKFERLEGKFERLDAKMGSEIERLEGKMKSEIGRLEGSVERVDGKIDRVEMSLKAELKSEIASVKVDVIRWVLMLNVAAVGLLFAAMKLFK